MASYASEEDAFNDKETPISDQIAGDRNTEMDTDSGELTATAPVIAAQSKTDSTPAAPVSCKPSVTAISASAAGGIKRSSNKLSKEFHLVRSATGDLFELLEDPKHLDTIFVTKYNINGTPSGERQPSRSAR